MLVAFSGHGAELGLLAGKLGRGGARGLRGDLDRERPSLGLCACVRRTRPSLGRSGSQLGSPSNFSLGIGRGERRTPARRVHVRVSRCDAPGASPAGPRPRGPAPSAARQLVDGLGQGRICGTNRRFERFVHRRNRRSELPLPGRSGSLGRVTLPDRPRFVASHCGKLGRHLGGGDPRRRQGRKCLVVGGPSGPLDRPPLGEPRPDLPDRALGAGQTDRSRGPRPAAPRPVRAR